MSDQPGAPAKAETGPDAQVGGQAASPVAEGAAPGPPRPMPFDRSLLYFGASLVFGITQGLGINLVTANLPAFQSFFGATTVEASWLSAAYLATSSTASLLLFKIRFQFGLRIFAEVGLLLFILVSLAHLFVNDLNSAILVRAVLGLVAAPLTSIALLYAFEPLPQQKKFTLGLCLGLCGSQLAAPLARVISPDLLQAVDWHGLYFLEIGLAFVCLPLLYLLPLTPPPRMVMFDRMDAVTLPLLAGGFGAIVVAMTFGPLYWWTSVWWIGACLAAGVLLLTLAVVVELNRTRPTINLRWISTFDVLALAGALLVFRFLLSEQTVGVVGFLRVFGLTNDQEHGLFGIVLAATAAGYATTALTVRPGREPVLHMVSLTLIAAAAFMDSRVTNLWTPEQFYLSQAMIGFAGGLFLPPAMLSGISRALLLGMQNLLSFVVVFSATQSVGALVSSAILQSFVTIRTQFHLGSLAAGLTPFDPLVSGRIQQYGAAYAQVLADPALRNAEGVASLGQLATREANVLAYRDMFLLIAAAAGTALVILVVHTLATRLLRAPAEARAA